MTATDFLLWVQSIRNPVLTGLFAAITFMGSEEFTLIFMALLYWCYDRAVGVRAVLVLTASYFLNVYLKDLFAVARPSSPLVPLYAETTLNTYAFPSGHAQASTSAWGMVALLARRTYLYIAAAIIILLVGLSRLYLAVHWPLDVIGGWLIGFGLILLGMLLITLGSRYPRTLPWLLAGIAAPLIMIVVHPTPDAAKAAGATFGVVIGWWLERRYIRFESTGTRTQQFLKIAIGLAVLFLIRFLLKPVLEILPGNLIEDFVRYVVMAVWVAAAAPAIFVRLFGRVQQGVHLHPADAH